MVILLNMFVVIEETNLTAAEEEVYPWLRAVGYTMTSIYIVELALRMYAFRCEFWTNSWNVFDFFIVSVDLISLCLGLIVDIPSVAPLRILRLVRLTRAVRILLAFPELYMIIKGIAGAAKTIIWGIALVLGVLTLYSIMAVVLIHPINKRIAERDYYADHCERCPRAFSSVWHAILTFSQQIIAGDSWGQLCTPIIEEEPASFFFFLLVLVSISLGLMNLMLAVIVERAHEAHQSDVAHLAKIKAKDQRKAHKKLIEMCAEMDSDGSGTMSLEELKDGYTAHAEFRKTLEVMDIKEEDLEMVFRILDSDGSGDVHYVEFAEQLHSLKSQDERTLLVFIKHLILDMHRLANEAKTPARQATPQHTSNACQTVFKSPASEASDDRWNQQRAAPVTRLGGNDALNVTMVQHLMSADANHKDPVLIDINQMPISPLYNPRDPAKPPSKRATQQLKTAGDAGEYGALTGALTEELKSLRSSHEEFTAALRDIAKKWDSHAEAISSMKMGTCGEIASSSSPEISSLEKLREVLPLHYTTSVPHTGDSGEIQDAFWNESQWRTSSRGEAAPRMILPTCCSTIRVPARDTPGLS
jgi:voltage-gated sodium channel